MDVQQIVNDEGLNAEILEAAKLLFAKYGLKKTTMEDVAKAVGKGKSTLYYYYPGKTELFEAVVKAEMDSAVKVIRLAVNEEKKAKLKFEAYLISRLKLKQEYDNLRTVINEDIFDHFQDIVQLKSGFEETNVEFIKEIILNGVQTGEFKKMTDEEITFFANWINAAFVGLELSSKSSKCVSSSKESCIRLVELIINGISK